MRARKVTYEHGDIILDAVVHLIHREHIGLANRQHLRKGGFIDHYRWQDGGLSLKIMDHPKYIWVSGDGWSAHYHNDIEVKEFISGSFERDLLKMRLMFNV